MKRPKIWITVSCALALGLWAGALLLRPGETITFRIVDRSIRLPITNVSLTVVQRWTKLPIERLGVPGVSSWRTNTIICPKGTITFPFCRKFEKRAYVSSTPPDVVTVSFRQRYYRGATYYEWRTPWSSSSISYEDGQGRQVDRKGEVLVEMQRRLAVDGFPPP